MPKSTEAPAETQALAPTTGLTQVEKINTFLALQPTVDEDPTEAMLQRILEAPDPSLWEKVFNSASFKDAAARQVRIHTYRTSPSDFKGGLKHYLILDVSDLKTGEHEVMTCSSVMSIAQILNAEARVGLPIDVEIVQKEKPTKAGFRPIHLRYLGQNGAPLGDPKAVVSEQ